MADIKKRIERASNLTTFVVLGILSAAEAIDAVKGEGEDRTTVNNLWDLTKADLYLLVMHELSKIGRRMAEFDHLRPSGRTAFLVSEDGAEAVSELFAEVSKSIFERDIVYRVTSDKEDAMAFLMGRS